MNKLLSIKQVLSIGIGSLSLLIQSKSLMASEKTVTNTTQLLYSDMKNPFKLHGHISENQYYSEKNLFSCQVQDFGRGSYIANDITLDDMSGVIFYHPSGHFKKAEVISMPVIKTKSLNKEDLQQAFETFGVGLIKAVDQAKGIQILQQKILSNGALFSLLSVDSIRSLKEFNVIPIPAIIAYLIYKEQDKLIILSYQKATPFNENPPTEVLTETMKQDILAFKETFVF